MLGYELATVTADPVETLADFATRRGIGFTLLSDPETAAIRAFDLLNDRSAGFRIAHPAIFVIDRDGVVRHRFSKRRYTERPPVDLVLEALR